MDSTDIYTFTVIRNHGAPISFTIRRWKLVASIAIFSIFFLISAYFTLMYFLLNAEGNKLKTQLSEVTIQAEQLAKNISDRNQESFYAENETSLDSREQVKGALTTQAEFSTSGIWSNQSQNLLLNDMEAANEVEVQKFDASLRGDKLTLNIRLHNTSDPFQIIGGYVFTVLMNEDMQPAIFKSVTGGEMGENGYPVSFKSGSQYYLKRKTQRIRQRFQLENVEDYYTTATIFVFSYKGELISKQSYPLDKELFLE
jgi:hypothetical protein